jgi:hypothetical protein
MEDVIILAADIEKIFVIAGAIAAILIVLPTFVAAYYSWLSYRTQWPAQAARVESLWLLVCGGLLIIGALLATALRFLSPTMAQAVHVSALKPYILIAIGFLGVICVDVALRMRGTHKSESDRQPDPEYRRFARTLAGRIAIMNDDEGWNDKHFIELEVEVMRRTDQRPVGLLMKRFGSRTQLEPSLDHAIERSGEQVLVLQGEPGSGKSVALRHLTRKLCEHAQESDQVPIPVYVDLRLLRTEGRPVNAKLIESFVLRILEQWNPEIAAFAHVEFAKTFHARPWIFLFDSFDEIPEITTTTELHKTARLYAHAIYEFILKWSNCRGVIASREFRGPETMNWPMVRIKSLSERRKLDLVRKLGLDPEIEQALMEQIVAAPPSIRQLSENPLLLSLLCEYVRERQRMPQTAHEVFEGAMVSRYGLDPADSASPLDGYAITGGQVRKVAEEIAFCMEVEVGQAPTRSELFDAMMRHGFSVDAEVEMALNVLQDIKLARRKGGPPPGRSGSPAFTFVKRRFQEYFATCVVLREPWRVPMPQLLTDARWQETAVTMCQLQTPDQLRALLIEAERVLDEAIKDAPAILPLPPLPKECVYYKRARPGQPSFSWAPRALHVLGILDAGFGVQSASLPDSLRHNVDKLLVTAYCRGSLLNRKWALEVAGAASREVLVWLLQQAFRSGSDWLKEVASSQLGRLEEVPKGIARAVRQSLCSTFLEGRLRARQLAITAELKRLQNPEPFLTVKDLLLRIPPVDFAFFLLISVMAIPVSGEFLYGIFIGHVLGYGSGSWLVSDDVPSSERVGHVRDRIPNPSIALPSVVRGIAGVYLIATSPGILRPLVILIVFYMATWVPTAYLSAYHGLPIERRQWVVLQFIVLGFMAEGARACLSRTWKQFRARDVLARATDWFRGLYWRQKILVGAVLVLLISAIIIPTIRVLCVLAIYVLFQVLVLVFMFRFIGWLVVGIVRTPGEGIEKVREMRWLRKWSRSLPNYVDGREVLQWIEALRTKDGFARMIHEIDKHNLLYGRPDALNALSDLTLVIETAAFSTRWPTSEETNSELRVGRRHQSMKLKPGDVVAQLVELQFTSPHMKEWLKNLGPKSWSLLEELNGENVDEIWQVIERAQRAEST